MSAHGPFPAWPGRLVKGALALSIGAFALLAALGNLTHYDSNWVFVRHVLAMDSMAPWLVAPRLVETRAVTDPVWQHAVYRLIIGGELLCGLLCAAGGAWMLGGAVARAGHRFARGRTLFTLGCLPGLLVWYTGFVVIGGEYFLMWANRWNGQMKALAITAVMLLALIYISLPEEEETDAM